jgi:hypothetical protein
MSHGMGEVVAVGAGAERRRAAFGHQHFQECLDMTGERGTFRPGLPHR